MIAQHRCSSIGGSQCYLWSTPQSREARHIGRMTVTAMHAAAALAAALLVAPAVAQDHAPATRSQTVSSADLDLRDARDVARLDLRIARAARQLCGDASAFDMIGRRKARQCADAAAARVADARAAAIDDARTTMMAGR